jgi:hypothetical protein
MVTLGRSIEDHSEQATAPSGSPAEPERNFGPLPGIKTMSILAEEVAVKRIPKILAAALVIVWCLPAAALAASPAATTGAATKISQTGVVLHGRVDPNGVATGYVFEYGPTPNLGIDSVSHSVGAGSKGVDVARPVGGLTPGTVYYYRIAATSRAGTAFGAIHHFTTGGHPPPAVVTGVALNVRKTVATPTGLINANGGATSWQVQYGLTATYGLQTAIAPLTPVTATALPVSAQLFGLAPATLFHYRIVAVPAVGPASYGADATFFTEPDRRPVPRFSPHTSPGSDKQAPYTFTTTGTLRGASFIPAVNRCAGKVGVRYFNGTRQLAIVVAPVGGDCRFNAQASFKRTHGKGAVPLRVTVDFRGNGYLAPVNKVNHVSAG